MSKRKCYILCAVWTLIGGAVAGVAMDRLSVDSDLNYEIVEVTAVLNKASNSESSIDSIAKKLRNSGIRVAAVDEAERVIVLEPRVNFLGFGAKWIVHCKHQKGSKVCFFTYTLQPVGFP